jgi:hypothetical protein
MGLAQNSQDVAFTHDQQLLPLVLHFGTGIFGEKNAVAFLNLQRYALSILQVSAAYSNDFALLRLFLRSIGKYDAARRGPPTFSTLIKTSIFHKTPFLIQRVPLPK